MAQLDGWWRAANYLSVGQIYLLDNPLLRTPLDRAHVKPAGTEELGTDPDVAIAAAGDVPTLEALAAADILRTRLPGLKIRFINVVDLMKLQDDSEHPHGLSARDFDMIFTREKPIIFAYHAVPGTRTYMSGATRRRAPQRAPSIW